MKGNLTLRFQLFKNKIRINICESQRCIIYHIINLSMQQFKKKNYDIVDMCRWFDYFIGPYINY